LATVGQNIALLLALIQERMVPAQKALPYALALSAMLTVLSSAVYARIYVNLVRAHRRVEGNV
jgi:hypothetical protein